jgi:hypothetical protein
VRPDVLKVPSSAERNRRLPFVMVEAYPISFSLLMFALSAQGNCARSHLVSSSLANTVDSLEEGISSPSSDNTIESIYMCGLNLMLQHNLDLMTVSIVNFPLKQSWSLPWTLHPNASTSPQLSHILSNNTRRMIPDCTL